MPPEKKLFNNIKWGVTPSSHVAHIIEDDNGTVIDPNKDFDPRRVSHDEIFANSADEKTKNIFMGLAQKANSDYQKYWNIDGFPELMEGIKEYLTADSRRKQQSKLANVRKRISEYKDTLAVDSELKDVLQGYENFFAEYTNGNLDVRGKTSANIEATGEIDEPGSTWRAGGFFGSWSQSDNVLFPHEPSPNDIKQGVGAQDCFMLSALTKIAKDNPQEIRNAMRDNGDGTVTVRFYDYGAAKDNEEKQPVYITVNKTIRTVAGANTYAAGSLWVQLFEKAYATYRNTVEAKHNLVDNDDAARDGYYSINRSSPHKFLNAFRKDNHVGTVEIGYNVENDDVELYDIDNTGKPKVARHPGYCQYEKNLFNFLKEHTKGSEVITVGCNTNNAAREDFVKSHGIRTGHAYTVMKAFEKEVDGEMKKFIQVRDPFASFSAKYDSDGLLQGEGTTFGNAVSGAFHGGLDNMGVFNLEVNDFCKSFGYINGIRKDLADEFEKTMSRGQLKPEDFVVEKPEMVAQRKEGENPILDLLDQEGGFEKIKLSLETLSNNLGATDKWYVWSNHKDFRDMRNSLYSLRDQFDKMAKENRYPTTAERNKIVAAFADLKTKTSIYGNRKAVEIANATPDNPAKQRSKDRHNFSMQITNLCNGIPTAPSSKDLPKNLNYLVTDMHEVLKKGNQNEIDENEINIDWEDLVSDSKQAQILLKDNKQLADRAGIDQNTLDDFALQTEIAKEKHPTKAQDKQKQAADDFGFEIMDDVMDTSSKSKDAKKEDPAKEDPKEAPVKENPKDVAAAFGFDIL